MNQNVQALNICEPAFFELDMGDVDEVSGGIPLFLAIALYGEIALWAGFGSALATVSALESLS